MGVQPLTRAMLYLLTVISTVSWLSIPDQTLASDIDTESKLIYIDRVTGKYIKQSPSPGEHQGGNSTNSPPQFRHAAGLDTVLLISITLLIFCHLAAIVISEKFLES